MDTKKTDMMNRAKHILCFGASTAEGLYDEEGLGWPVRLNALLQAELAWRYWVVNLGNRADTSADMFQRVQMEVPPRAADVVILQIPCRDVAVQDGEDAPILPIQTLPRLWLRMIRFIQRYTDDILVVPHHFHDPVGLDVPGLTYRQDLLREQKTVLRRFCHEHDVCFLDLEAAFAAGVGHQGMADCIHANARGHAFMAREIFSELKLNGLLDRTEMRQPLMAAAQ